MIKKRKGAAHYAQVPASRADVVLSKFKGCYELISMPMFFIFGDNNDNSHLYGKSKGAEEAPSRNYH